MAILRPYLGKANIKPISKVILGTVNGDLHDIGKNLVGMMLEGAGFDVIDIGIDVPSVGFVEAVREYQPRFIGMSARLTTTMLNMVNTIEALRKAGLRDEVTVMVGRGPLTQEFANEIGADLYAPNAASSVTRVKALLATT